MGTERGQGYLSLSTAAFDIDIRVQYQVLCAVDTTLGSSVRGEGHCTSPDEPYEHSCGIGKELMNLGAIYKVEGTDVSN